MEEQNSQQMAPGGVDVISVYQAGLKVMNSNFFPLLGVVLSLIGISLVSSVLSNVDNILFNLLGSIWNFFVVVPVSIGAAGVYLAAVRGQEIKISNIFALFSNQTKYLNSLLATFITGLMIGLGLIFFIIPGIYIAIRMSFLSYVLIEEDLGAMDSIKRAWELSDGHALTIFLMAIIALGLIFLGVLALIVGVFVSIVWIAVTSATLYDRVIKMQG